MDNPRGWSKTCRARPHHARNGGAGENQGKEDSVRPIKFRGWDVREQKMIGGVTPSPNHYSDVWTDCGISGEHGEYSAEDLKLMQFTGLKDKNGKEIYEGDILKSDGSYPLEVYWMGLAWGVRWNDNGSKEESIICDDSGDMEMDKNGLKHMAVIGNIHENGELLK